MLMKKYALGKLSFKTFLPPKTETLYSLSSYSSTVPPANHQSAFCFYGCFSYSGCKYTSFYCALLYCIFFFFPNWKFVAILHLASLFGAIFLTAFAHLVFLCHILVILTVFHTFSLSYLLWWSVVIVLRWHKLYLDKSANLIDKCVYSHCPLTSSSPLLSLYLSLPIPRDTTVLKLSQLIALQ